MMRRNYLAYSRSEYGERFINCLKNEVKRDITACVRDVKRLLAELKNIKEFAESNSDEFFKDITFDTRDLIFVYKTCEELASGVKKMMRILDTTISTGLTVCRQNVELIREISENGAIEDAQNEVQQTWDMKLGYESPLVDTD